MKKFKKQNGITLIALVITIIVMLILVGVSVTVALNGGLFTTAKQAAEGTASKRNEELELSSGKVEIDGEWYNSIDEYVNGGSSNEPTEPENPTGYTAYSIGDTVTIGTENFYVIADSDATQEKVTLLAKDNIDTTTLVQSASAGTVAFSSTNYWSTIEGITYPYDLNDTPTSADTDAIAKARAYGTALGGTGRLMTYSEAEALKTTNSGILYGNSNYSSSSGLNYWLGSAYDIDSLWITLGKQSTLYGEDYDNVNGGSYGPGHGVRPVVEISKSNIS